MFENNNNDDGKSSSEVIENKIMLMESVHLKTNTCSHLLPNIIASKHQKEIREEMNPYTLAIRYYQNQDWSISSLIIDILITFIIKILSFSSFGCQAYMWL